MDLLNRPQPVEARHLGSSPARRARRRPARRRLRRRPEPCCGAGRGSPRCASAGRSRRCPRAGGAGVSGVAGSRRCRHPPRRSVSAAGSASAGATSSAGGSATRAGWLQTDVSYASGLAGAAGSGSGVAASGSGSAAGLGSAAASGWLCDRLLDHDGRLGLGDGLGRGLCHRLLGGRLGLRLRLGRERRRLPQHAPLLGLRVELVPYIAPAERGTQPPVQFRAATSAPVAPAAPTRIHPNLRTPPSIRRRQPSSFLSPGVVPHS